MERWPKFLELTTTDALVRPSIRGRKDHIAGHVGGDERWCGDAKFPPLANLPKDSPVVSICVQVGRKRLGGAPTERVSSNLDDDGAVLSGRMNDGLPRGGDCDRCNDQYDAHAPSQWTLDIMLHIREVR